MVVAMEIEVVEEQRKKSSISDGGARSGPSAILFVSVLVVLISPFILGFTLAFTSPAEETMKGGEKVKLSPEEMDRLKVFDDSTQADLFASVLNLGCMAGALSGGAMSDRIGRKWTLCVSAVPMLLAYSLCAFVKQPVVLILSRVVMGIGVGIGGGVAPTYIAEVSTPGLRGGLGAATQLSVTIAIFAVGLLGGTVLRVGEDKDLQGCQWRSLAFCGVGLTAALMMTSLVPESPKFWAKKGRMDKAEASLRLLRSDPAKCESELKELAAETDTATSFRVSSGDTEQAGQSTSGLIEASTTSESIFAPQYRRVLIGGMGVLLFQQLSGINAIIFYTVTIIKDAGIGNAESASLAIMGMQVLFTLASCFVMDMAKRKVWLLSGSCVMATCLFVLAAYFGDKGTGESQKMPGMLALVCLVAYIIAFSLGWGPIPWLMQAELFPTSVRSMGTSLGVLGNWTMAFMVTFGFKFVSQNLGAMASFLILGIFVSLGALFVLFMVPETRGKTVEQVLDEINSGDSRLQRADGRDVQLITASS